MTAYSQLSDAELVRKVQELMVYSVRYHGFGWDNNPATYNLYNGDILFFSAITEDSAWSHAPDPLTDANVCNLLKNELLTKWHRLEVITQRGWVMAKLFSETGNCIQVVTKTEARAICEVYCQVREGKG